MSRRCYGEGEDMEKGYYSPTQVRKILGVRQQTLYMMLETHMIPAFKIGSRWKIPINLFDEWMKERATAHEQI